MEEIRIIKQSDNDGFVPALEPQYVVLGMIDEYLGRRVIEGIDAVEHFYENERPLVGVFVKYLSLYGAGLGVGAEEISISDAKEGHTYVESVRMNAYVNALYHFEFPPDQFITYPGGRRHRFASVGLSIDDLPKKSPGLYRAEEMNPRFSYLYGAVLRYGHEQPMIRLANAIQKVELIKRILSDLDVKWIGHKYFPGETPVVHEITFGPDQRLEEFLQSALNERAAAFARPEEKPTPVHAAPLQKPTDKT